MDHRQTALRMWQQLHLPVGRKPPQELAPWGSRSPGCPGVFGPAPQPVLMDVAQLGIGPAACQSLYPHAAMHLTACRGTICARPLPHTRPMRSVTFACCLLLIAGLLRLPIAHAQAAAPEAGALATLHVLQVDGGHELWAENHLPGPVEVMVSAARPPANAAPALPARATLPAHGRGLVARIQADAIAALGLRLSAVPGAPGGRLRDVEYRFPLQMPAAQVAQGHGGHHSHADAENLHAVDFAAPIGTPVLAARDGLVLQAEGGFRNSGGTVAGDAGRANFIRILHDDGSMAVYAHLDHGGVLVHPGQHVRTGQRIGRSGNSGYSAGPHLHFVVQANRGMRIESVPFRMFGPQGILRFALPAQPH